MIAPLVSNLLATTYQAKMVTYKHQQFCVWCHMGKGQSALYSLGKHSQLSKMPLY